MTGSGAKRPFIRKQPPAPFPDKWFLTADVVKRSRETKRCTAAIQGDRVLVHTSRRHGMANIQ
jgi:hypothetical protein